MPVPSRDFGLGACAIIMTSSQPQKLDDVIMMAQAPTPKLRLGTGIFLLSEQLSAVKPFLEKNAERFEIVTCLQWDLTQHHFFQASF